jgi:hypothetical protein
MIKMDTYQELGDAYENFMCKAFTDYTRKKCDLHNSCMVNLIAAEEGRKSHYLPSFEKQLKHVKENILKALDKYMKMSEYRNKKDELEVYKIIVNKAVHTQTLNDVINNVSNIMES